jgi:hypothetical protein
MNIISDGKRSDGKRSDGSTNEKGREGKVVYRELHRYMMIALIISWVGDSAVAILLLDYEILSFAPLALLSRIDSFVVGAEALRRNLHR